MVRLNNPELQRFVDDKVKAGRFASADAVIEAALEQMKWNEEHAPPTDDALERRLARADEQVARGEVLDWSVARERLAGQLGIAL